MGKRLPQSVINAGNRADEILASLGDEPIVAETPEATVVPVAVSTEAPAAPQVPPAPENKEGYWEHRFKTVEGILNAEKRRAADMLRDYEIKISNLSTQVKELASKAPAVPKEYDLRTWMTPEQIEGIGESLPNIMLKMATSVSQESAQSAVADVVKRELEPLRDRVKLAEAQTQQERVNGFWKVLQRAVPNWQAVNGDPKFQTWLGEREGFTRYTRDEVLKDAERNLDTDTVIDIFNGYIKAVTPPTVNPSVQRRVLPESVGSSVPSTTDDAPLFTSSQIRQHYNDLARGVYKNKSDEWSKLEAKMNAAIHSGRVSQVG